MAKRGTCGAEEARTRLPELLEKAHHGGTTLITRRGRPYAALVPAAGAAGGRRLSVLSLRGSGRGLWGTRSAKTIRAMRDEWS